jgi:ABC-2 type transport system ATP-binding protein
MSAAVVADGLTKRFGGHTALRSVSLAVPEGTVLALLGPNGAGKTTVVRILTTLLRPDAGSASVAGFDIGTNPAEVRRNIGVSGQYAAVDENLTGLENLDMIGRLYHLGRTRARQRAHELLAQFSLTDAATRLAKTYSGGMRRRLDLAAALVAAPPVLFLDEPTTGLDPRSRNHLWEAIDALVRDGTTLVLTTQYLDEAERLANRVVVIDRGAMIADGTPDELKSEVGGERLELHAVDEAHVNTIVAVLADLASDPPSVDGRRVSAQVTAGPAALMTAVRRLDDLRVEVNDAGLRHPTLDEVFLTLTGQPAVGCTHSTIAASSSR